MQQQRENSGVLFKNDRKEAEKHPDYKGEININGELYWLSAWLKTGTRGKFLSLAVQAKNPDARNPIVKPKPNDPAQQGPLDDEIPW